MDYENLYCIYVGVHWSWRFHSDIELPSTTYKPVCPLKTIKVEEEAEALAEAMADVLEDGAIEINLLDL